MYKSHYPIEYTISRAPAVAADVHFPVVIIGAGASGHCAALAAAEYTDPILLLERDALPSGSTALSSGMIPACNSLVQKAAGIDDSIEQMTQDILRKARGQTDADFVQRVCRLSGPCIDWLNEKHRMGLSLVEGFLYPGHSCLRMHAPSSKTGVELMQGLISAAQRLPITTLCNAHVTRLFVDGDLSVAGVCIDRPDGQQEIVACDTLILACNGFAGNAQMVAQYLPMMQQADYAGHPGNRGSAVQWGMQLNARMRDMGAYQGHGSVATPHAILISWALMMQGGIQINALGERFSNEHDGYSEQAQRVSAQPGAIAWDFYDQRLHELGLTFEDYRQADSAGAVIRCPDLDAVQATTGIGADKLQDTLQATFTCAVGQTTDPFGRDFSRAPMLQPPYYMVKVKGALFHTQGGMMIDEFARVIDRHDRPFANLYAGGGACRGLSGPSDWGYLSGNGLLTAVILGRLAGESAGQSLRQ